MPQSNVFARVFAEAVEFAGRRDGKLKKQLAAACDLRPDRFSHLLSGRRPPTNARMVVQIARGLRLDDAWTNRLLEAAGFDPILSPPTEGSAQLVSRLGEPERTIAQGEIERDIELIRGAWDHYVSLQSHIQAREWVDASNLFQYGLDQYWRLRAAAERYLAQVYFSAATSRYYTNRLREAQELCELGLDAARAADSRMFKAMLLVRLAGIERLHSDYTAAFQKYDAALEVLADWESQEQTAELSPRDREERREWRTHWQARIGRKRCSLLIQMGQPDMAERELKPIVEHFRRVGHHYELSQTLFGLGWAKSQLGDLDTAISIYAEGMEHAEAHSEARGHLDVLPLLRGRLYLGTSHIETGDLDRAREELVAAMQLADRPPLRDYQEAGRVYVQLGRLHLEKGEWAEARKHLIRALEFSAIREDKILLAQAHNVMGWYHLRAGGPPHVERALDEYQRALAAARASRPSSRYYECAALVNICTARLRGGPPAVERVQRRPSAPEVEWEIDELIEATREIGRERGYFGHLARLALLEAEWALRGDDRERAGRAADDAHHCSRNYNRYLQRTVDRRLRDLGLPRA